MPGATARLHQKTPSVLIASTRFHSSSLTSCGPQRGAGDAGGADEHVDRAELGGRPRATAASTSCESGDVARRARARPSIPARLQVERRDPRALGEQALGGGRADAAGGARDERHPAGKSMIVCHDVHPIKSHRHGFRSNRRLPARLATTGSRRDAVRPRRSTTSRSRRRGRDGSPPPTSARPPRRCSARPRSPARPAAGSSPTTSSAPPSSPRVPDDRLLEIYTALRPGRSTAAELEEWARRLEGWEAPRTAAFVREAAAGYVERGLCRWLSRRPRLARSPRAPRRSCGASCSSRRCPSSGSSRRTGRTIPSRSSSSRTASSTRMDGRAAAEFDVIDRFLVAHGLDLDIAAEAMALPDVEIARHARRRRRAARRARPARARADARRSSRASPACSTRSS